MHLIPTLCHGLTELEYKWAQIRFVQEFIIFQACIWHFSYFTWSSLCCNFGQDSRKRVFLQYVDKYRQTKITHDACKCQVCVGGRGRLQKLLYTSTLNLTTLSYCTEPQTGRSRVFTFKGEPITSFGLGNHSYPGGRLLRFQGDAVQTQVGGIKYKMLACSRLCVVLAPQWRNKLPTDIRTIETHNTYLDKKNLPCSDASLSMKRWQRKRINRVWFWQFWLVSSRLNALIVSRFG